VIVISADTNLQSVVKGILMGAEDYLPKPFEPVLLQARITSSLEKKRLRDLQSQYLKGLEREIEIARQMQQSFLPKTLPDFQGWEIGVYIKAAHEVAGDYYDVFTLPNGWLISLIGDVCDKGVGSALFMALFRSLIRAIAASGEICRGRSGLSISPADFLEQLVSFTNQYVCETHGDSGLFTTLFICVLNPNHGSLTYINAGNEPPVWLTSNGQLTELHPTGPVVGVIPGVVFKALEIQLSRDDLVIAYTDGVTDALDARNNMLGKRRLHEMVKSSPHTPAQMLEVIAARIQSFSGEAEQFDDITMLAMRKV
jgi:serine phosphatase RsbU (regulator of sigma subunit)